MNYNKKIEELKIELPEAKAPVGSYVATKIVGKLLYISGQISMSSKPFYSFCTHLCIRQLSYYVERSSCRIYFLRSASSMLYCEQKNQHFGSYFSFARHQNQLRFQLKQQHLRMNQQKFPLLYQVQMTFRQPFCGVYQDSQP